MLSALPIFYTVTAPLFHRIYILFDDAQCVVGVIILKLVKKGPK